jgi:hypothetical protein
MFREGILRHEPHAGPRGTGPFGGSYDWHSCVHAHWALLSIAQVTHDRRLERWVRVRLTPRALERERRFLRTNPSFERPYGRAWLTLLLHELGGARAFEREVRADVLGWLSCSPFPELGRVCRADHHSWLFAYFLLRQGIPDDPKLDRLRPKLRNGAPAALRRRPIGWDFLHLPSLLALLGEAPVPRAPVRPVKHVTRRNGHACGRTAQRLWPLSGRRYESGLRRVLARTDHWRDDFLHVAHWVPQFLWMSFACRYPAQ